VKIAFIVRTQVDWVIPDLAKFTLSPIWIAASLICPHPLMQKAMVRLIADQEVAIPIIGTVLVEMMHNGSVGKGFP
jgi:hypothetical protein